MFGCSPYAIYIIEANVRKVGYLKVKPLKPASSKPTARYSLFILILLCQNLLLFVRKTGLEKLVKTALFIGLG